MTAPIQDVVREQYGKAAQSDLSGMQDGLQKVAEAFGYSREELASIPAEANLGVSCGNPTAFAGLKPGEVVVDLGCGGGLDVLLASRKVGPTGRSIGIDMTPEMLTRARENAARGVRGVPFTNVEFHLATIDRLPLADASVDCVVSNCVINLAPDKSAVFREIARVLKPGGRLACSDIALKQALPEELQRDLFAWVGCFAGAISIQEYQQGLRAAGFEFVEVIDSGADLNAYALVDQQAGCCTPAMVTEIGDFTSSDHASPQIGDGQGQTSCCADRPPASLSQQLAELLQRFNVNDYAASVKVFALKGPLPA